MRSKTIVFLASLVLMGGMFSTGPGEANAQNPNGAVFVMSNAAENNQIDAYVRHADGSLQADGVFSTGGDGSGGTVDPLHSQGSLVLSNDHQLLFAVNAGSGTVSSFAVHASTLTLLGTEPSGGTTPSALAQNGNLLYVLNSGGDGNVSGFHVAPGGRLKPIENSTRDLSGNTTSPTSLAISPNGRFLVVTESATNNIDVFRIYPDGSLSDVRVDPSSGVTPFGAKFAPDGVVIVANNTSGAGTVSSYDLQWDGSLKVLSAAVPSLGSGTCWNVIAPDGRYTYTANANTSNLSGFAIGRQGTLTPLGATIVAANPPGSTNIDTAISEDGKFIYTLNGGSGNIGVFSVAADGSVTFLTTVGGLPPAGGLNGIAAY